MLDGFVGGGEAYYADRGGDYVDRYEQARLLFDGDRTEEAVTCFLDLYAKGLKEKTLPRFDRSFRAALLKGDRWGQLTRVTAAALVKDKRRPAAITLAWQCRGVDDTTLADELLALALDRVPDDERLAVTP